MKKLRLIIATLFFSNILITTSSEKTFSQSWNTFDISFSGCSALFPYEPVWEISYAEDSSLVWLGEAMQSDIYFGAICVEFSAPLDFESTKDDLVLLAQEYLTYLQTEFNIVAHSGYNISYVVENYENACQVTDEWEDTEGDSWLINVWIDPYNMAVMYMYSGPENNMNDYSDMFFNSFRFPE